MQSVLNKDIEVLIKVYFDLYQGLLFSYLIPFEKLKGAEKKYFI